MWARSLIALNLVAITVADHTTRPEDGGPNGILCCDLVERDSCRRNCGAGSFCTKCSMNPWRTRGCSSWDCIGCDACKACGDHCGKQWETFCPGMSLPNFEYSAENDICSPPPPPNPPPAAPPPDMTVIFVISGAGGGGLLLVIIAVVAYIFLKKKKAPSTAPQGQEMAAQPVVKVPIPAGVPVPLKGAPSKVEALKELKALLDDGTLTQEEFALEKMKILGSSEGAVIG